MTNKNNVDISLVIDRSGSMSSIHGAIVEGLIGFIRSQRKAAAENDLKTRITYAQFDTVYEMLARGSDLDAFVLPPLVPRGSTALYDAIGRTINDTGNRLSDMPENSRPGKVLFVIVTDGLENSSTEFNRFKVKEMIAKQQTTYSWEFMFLGANIDAQEVAVDINIPFSNSMTFGANDGGTRSAFLSASNSAVAYTVGGAACANFSQADYANQKVLGGVDNVQTIHDKINARSIKTA